ncbi:hypothetical protein H9Y05_04170 [Crocinitomicaceae bacterium CZZ-1]|uniref:Uncharacterized protein n=1 Tax=Taishania pollutisoli TaxID=2766479 RepID=A0A8J6U1W8_9FLAO|nr:hypothetical protein [Taishania pollutisoli]MBC9811665.1 hypothetical protein [Taishania pollutisoli]
MTRLLIISMACLVLAACKKDSVMTGSNTQVYRSPQGYPSKITPTLVGNVLIIENADVYPNIMGIVSGMANSNTTNDKLNWVKDIQISKLRLAYDVHVEIISDGSSFVRNHLTDSKLIYSYYPSDNSGEKKVTLANYAGIGSTSSQINYTSTGEDITQLMKDNPGGQLYVSFSFDANSPSPVSLGYYIAFDYDYSYSTMESKNS